MNNDEEKKTWWTSPESPGIIGTMWRKLEKCSMKIPTSEHSLLLYISVCMYVQDNDEALRETLGFR